MLYKKNSAKKLDDSLFKSPTAEYRGTPFWSWNDKLDKDELCWQIEQLKEMGFGGFHMHSRSGMATPYLSDEFMDLVRACTDKAKKEEMLSYLYDEDRWPSGAAGGIVTKEQKHRQKYLTLTPEVNETAETSTAILPDKNGFSDVKAAVTACAEAGKCYLLAVFDIVLDADGYLQKGKMISPDAVAEGNKWYAYVYTAHSTGRFNGQAYADTLSKETIAEFIRVTYEAYERAVGDEFDKTVPSIFTDEPQFKSSAPLPFAESLTPVTVPWTTDLPETYAAAYGRDLVADLPEIFWDMKDQPARARYCFRDHLCTRFTEAFADQCGKWCDEHGIALTGHMMEEPTLQSQTHSLGEAMRAYRGFAIPGIDMLCDWQELSTAKQTQSAVHQYGREAMLSELYGVTGWEFDFRGHKFQGDWQAALGVTVRVPHLSWVSMRGSAKRDYPASISYQSAWYKEYPYIEDHFARLNTALTRGKPAVNIGVIHPIESYWMAYGPSSNTAAKRAELQENFDNVINWLLRGQMDFDFICESLLPEQYAASDDKKLHIGAMQYSAILVPALDTIRSSTVRILTEYVKKGGKLIFAGKAPKYVDAMISSEGKALFDLAEQVSMTSVSILDALESEREVQVFNASGTPSRNYIYNKRIDGDREWVFLATATRPATKGRRQDDTDLPQDLVIRLKGKKRPTLYDTLTGEIKPIAYEIRGNMTQIPCTLYPYDSLLLCLEDADGGSYTPERVAKTPTYKFNIKQTVEYALGEPNVLVLDMPEWSMDGENWSPREEMLRIDLSMRRKYGWPKADGADSQPWVIAEQRPELFPYLRFTFHSEIEVPCKLGFEEAEQVWFNGVEVPLVKDGYFTDKCVHTAKLPNVQKGENVLVIRAPLGKRTSLENYFLLGEFGVRVDGCEASILPLQEKIGFGSITEKGLPFYGAALTYKIPVEVKDCDLAVSAQRYKGTLITAKLDGQEVGKIVFAPYRIEIPNVSAGKHLLELTLYNSRVNCFGALHAFGDIEWKGPSWWYTHGKDFAYEYQLFGNGILKSPVIEVFEK